MFKNEIRFSRCLVLFSRLRSVDLIINGKREGVKRDETKLLTYLALGQFLKDLIASGQLLRRESIEGEGGAETLRRNNFNDSVLMRMLYVIEVLDVFHGLLELLFGWPICLYLLNIIKRDQASPGNG